MVKAVKITNHLGEELYVDLSNYRETGFIVRSIEGLGPVNALINTSTLAGKDGAVFNSSKVEQRNIVFNMTLVTPDNGDDEESVRLRCDRIFATKRMVTMDFLTESRYVTINGYVETNEQDIFKNRTDVQISVICPDPFFYSVNTDNSRSIFLNSVIPMFYFPYPSTVLNAPVGQYANNDEVSVYYDGETDVGITITIDFGSDIQDMTYIMIQKINTDEIFRIDVDKISSVVGSAPLRGDRITIRTERGSKKAILTRNGVDTNIINCIARNSDWIRLDHGENKIAYYCDHEESSIFIQFEYSIAYVGV